MRLVEVIPIAHRIGSRTLTYFTSLDLPRGALVMAPLRSRSVPAIVMSSTPAEEEKSALRRSSYRIKKLTAAKAEPFLLPQFLEAAEDAARFNASSAGATLSALLPAHILAKPKALPTPAVPVRGSYEKLLLQASDEERFSHYKSTIREYFAKKKSVILLLPTIREATTAYEMLGKGIDEYAFLLHGDLSGKEQRARWQKALETPHPVLLVVTGGFLSLPRADVGLIILDHESSRAYHDRSHPYLDMRKFAEMFARRLGVKFLCGDLMLSIAALKEWREGEASEASALQFRFSFKVGAEVIDMRKNRKDHRGNLIIVSPLLEEAIEKTLQSGGRAFLFAARRGISPLTVCDDCGEAMRCGICASPLRLHRESGKKPFFLCPSCGTKEDAAVRCKKCGGWRLLPLGIGAERLEEEARKRFPHAEIFRLDRDAAKNNKEALAIAQKFYETPGSILIGTEMAVGYLGKKVELAAIVSLDSLLSIPDIVAHERIFSLLLRLRSRVKERFLIETRAPDAPVLMESVEGAGAEFYRRELSEREALGYPPFTTLIKITRVGNQEAVRRDLKALMEALPEPSVTFENPSTTRSSALEAHLLLKLKEERWPDEEILSILRDLPPQFIIRVNPESVL